MPSRPFLNPFLALPPSELTKVMCRVSARDRSFIDSLFPALIGKNDKILSNLYANLLAALREHERTFGPIEPAYGPSHPTYDLLFSLLGTLVQRPSAGSVARSPGPQHDAGRTHSVHPTNGVDAEQRTIAQSRDERGGGGKTQNPAQVPLVSRTGPLGKPITTSATLIESLKAKGIL